MKSWAVYDALLPTWLSGTNIKVSKTAHFHFFHFVFFIFISNFRRKQNG